MKKSYKINQSKIDEENDRELLNEDEFFIKYGYYQEDENFDWQTPLEFGDN